MNVLEEVRFFPPHQNLLTLVEGLPKMINDVQTVLNKLSDEAPGIMDPFESLGHIVTLLTMRAIGCDDIADDPVLLEKSMHWYEVIHKAATPMVKIPNPTTLTVLTPRLRRSCTPGSPHQQYLLEPRLATTST